VFRALTYHSLALVAALGLAALSTTTARAQVPVVVPAGGHVHGHSHTPGHSWLAAHHPPPIPRTFSYYYNYKFNQPRHFRAVGPDGQTYWRKTVHGLPFGTPLPSY
jgi:hypothetical protein